MLHHINGPLHHPLGSTLQCQPRVLQKGRALHGIWKDTLRAMKLLRVFGPFRFIEGLSLPPRVPPLEQPPTRAPGPRRCTTPPPSSVASSSSGVGHSTFVPHLEERVDLLEAHYVGVTTRLDQTTDLIERMTRR
ncbi:unnamed protein product [Linum trigynum]|uniref:Uncharacterized protein n=1 Tax=Linum trigynum TaxID=586398 RepID=A0AAV2GNX5_9ROSI